MSQPWLIRDRAPAFFAERRWPVQTWYDEALATGFRALVPPLYRSGLRDGLVVALTLWHGRRLRTASDAALQMQARALRPVLLRRGFRIGTVARAFALCREALRRELGFAHHAVQLRGGAQILSGRVAEMATGEGKTVTAALPAVAAALAGVPVHVVTVNDYLSRRDHDELAPVFARLGLRSAWIDADMTPAAKIAAYGAPIVYVTNKTLVFDYLRSRLGREGPDTVQRHAAATLRGRPVPPPMPHALGFCIVDEADSILIDEAQTPLIIAAPDTHLSEADCRHALAQARGLAEGQDFRLDHAQRRAELTRAGRALLAARAGTDWNAPALWQIARAREELCRHALAALHLHHRDQHYILAEDTVQIVDEFTGRVLADRQWQAGLHQMVEVKEGLPPGASRRTLAQITYQGFFRRYLWFGGMTGTGAEVARELWGTYGLGVTRVPRHRRLHRRDLGVRLYRDEPAKLQAVAARAARMVARGRPVLIGTRSVEVSERLGGVLGDSGLAHVVLNARQDGDEAALIARAGAAGAVTVATNMAGRGTDIRLTSEARAAGGLHVMLTEYHESPRIDRQLVGRAGRQGDPGSTEALVALDDDLFRRHAPRMQRAVAGLLPGGLRRLPAVLAHLLRWRAQRAAEARARLRREGVLRRADKLEKSLGFTRRPI